MRITRRRFVAGAAAGVVAGGVVPLRGMAEMMLGEARLTAISDGTLMLPGAFIFEGLPEEEVAAIVTPMGVSSTALEPPCNVTLLQVGDRVVLFDVGSGPDFMPSAGELVQNLEGAGVAPEDVTDVIFTHAHPDHIWGLLDEFDEPLFADARYMMGRAEWDYWWNPETVDTIGAERQAFAVGARRRMEAIEDAVVFFDDGEEVLPGVAAVACVGHTPGHMGFEIRQGSESVMVVGDAIGNHHVAFARPGWEVNSDQDKATAAATRVALMDRLAAEQMPLVGFHLPGAIGRAEKAGDGYRWVTI
ncbi:MBL fold metallo-hydrolase [Vannielia litorea]|uniref:Tat (Twin-arginine translocation) pathway signal sequence n=1 Tax=Vannielia litorea TaxID=1217970 RepID=A0A1N6GML5_9RHOB|nr:MBL fold metallo-hydrolase [Vannielia litorea]SIO08756.1 Tat (twin-arginine translocation) pathway signal sequence [Vannielia litorea]